MKIKSIVVTTLLSLSGAAAMAAGNSSSQVTLNADAQYGLSGGLSKTHTVAGLFNDTYTFSGVSGGSLVNSIFNTQGFSKAADIDISSISLNGVLFNLTKSTVGGYADARERGTLSNRQFSGPLVLVVSGYAGDVTLAPGTSINATYGGTLNVTPVPEPETLALMLAGLGAVGLVARRRAA